MLDFAHIGNYHENNRIEAKKALGGLPESIWETYSAFANALGGIILLGVEEYRDKTFHAVDLPDPEGMAEEFWKKLNDPKRVSVNILSRGDISIEESEGKRFLAVTVPRAQRYDRPVYIGPDPYGGSYRRNGEGDYHCTRDEVEAMFRDASFRSPDREVFPKLSWEVFDPDTVAVYREATAAHQPGNSFEKLKDKDFLVKIGAAAKAGGGEKAGGRISPTAAGILMFGTETARREQFPKLSLRYEETAPEGISREGKNLVDFYRYVSERLAEIFPERKLFEAVLEAVSNSLVNADYGGEGGISVRIGSDMIRVENPGGFRISLSSALLGGTSDPRNLSIRRMFSRVGVGSGEGLGITGIYETWRGLGYGRPVFSERFEPVRTELCLPLKADSEEAEGAPDALHLIRKNASAAVLKEQAIAYLTDVIRATVMEVASALSVRRTRAGEILASLASEGLVVQEGEGRKKTYLLRA